MTDYCFVIQPFDNGGKFDKRYDDIFKPAIESAGIKPYRVDKDINSEIPIESIEKGIENSKICLADITLDNPNVWYEVGFARANGRPLVLLCSDERTTPYPFDIRHRTILNYNTGSLQDYNELNSKITDKIRAIMANPVSVPKPENLNTDIDGLTYYEIAFLGAILKRQDMPTDGCLPSQIKEEMKSNGLNEIAFSIAFSQLSNKNLINSEQNREHDYNGNYLGDYTLCKISDGGLKWVLSNVDKFDLQFALQREEKVPTRTVIASTDA